MPGLFIKLQAETVSHFCNVSVLYIHPDEHASQKYEIVSSMEQGVHVTRVYYRISSSGLPVFSGLGKYLGFLQAVCRGLRSMDKNPPDLVHVHVLTRSGIIAFLLLLFKKIPYIITEHWSRYFKENNTYKGVLRKWIGRVVVRNAEGIIAVSERLRDSMLLHGLKNRDFRVVPNAVDMNRFVILKDRVSLPGSPIRIIHVSCFEDKSKNISGFLRIIQKVSLKRQDFTVNLIGEGPDWLEMKNYASTIGLKEPQVKFTGLKTGDDLIKELNLSDFFVLSSHYETFGIVILESMACGNPVVSTDVGIASSLINHENGLLAPPGDEQSLQAAIEKMLDDCRFYDRSKIRERVINLFNADLIARQIFDFYQEVLHS